MDKLSDFTIISSDGKRFPSYRVLLYKQLGYFRRMFDDVADDSKEHMSTFSSDVIRHLCDFVESIQSEVFETNTVDEYMDAILALDFYECTDAVLNTHLYHIDSRYGGDKRYVKFLVDTKHPFTLKYVEHGDIALRDEVLNVLPLVKWTASNDIVWTVFASENSAEKKTEVIVRLIKSGITSIPSDVIQYIAVNTSSDTVEKKMFKLAATDSLSIARNKELFIEMIIKHL
jgi:hypothetical protein